MKVQIQNQADTLLKGILDPFERIEHELRIQKEMDQMFSHNCIQRHENVQDYQK